MISHRLGPLVVLLALAACGGNGVPARAGSSGPGSPTPPVARAQAAGAQAGSPAAVASAGRTPGAAEGAGGSVVSLERSYTGQAEPTIVVRNGYPRAQHVFIDGGPVGAVAPGATASFEVSGGTHTITCADSADPEDNGSSLSEIFEPGYRYGYQIRAR